METQNDFEQSCETWSGYFEAADLLSRPFALGAEN